MPSTGRPARLSADQRAEQRAPADERLGAVDRVEVPDQLGIRALAAELLALDAVVGIARADQLAHRALGLAIGDRHRAGVGLALDRDRRAVVARDDRGRRIGQAGGAKVASSASAARRPRDSGCPAAQPPSGSGSGLSASERR